MFSPTFGDRSRRILLPVRLKYSIITTEFAPLGRYEPVATRAASPGRNLSFGIVPILTSPTISNSRRFLFGRFRAYPSRVDLAFEGTSKRDLTSSYNTL